MHSPFEAYMKEIIQQIDGSEEDKIDLKEELLTHLEQSKEEFINEGNSEEQAVLLSLQHFGQAKSIGKDMQQAMFPHRHLLFTLLAFLSLFTIFSTYITALFIDKDAHIIWLLTSVVTSIMVLIFTGHLFPKFERKSIMISLLIFHTFLMIYGYLIVGQLEYFLSIMLSFLCIITIIFTIFLIYRIVLYDYPFQRVSWKIIHIINMTLGVVYISLSLFYFWVVLAFFETIRMTHFIPLIPFIIWIIAYIVQIQLMKHDRERTAFIILGCTHLLMLGIVSLFLI